MRKILVNGEFVYPVSPPEPAGILDESGQPFLCPECRNQPQFIEDHRFYYLTCGCQTAAFEISEIKLSKYDNVTSEIMKEFLSQKWVDQVDGHIADDTPSYLSS